MIKRENGWGCYLIKIATGRADEEKTKCLLSRATEWLKNGNLQLTNLNRTQRVIWRTKHDESNACFTVNCSGTNVTLRRNIVWGSARSQELILSIGKRVVFILLPAVRLFVLELFLMRIQYK
jgi:hypothetical protein